MSKRSTKLLLADILESSEKILLYTRSMSYYDFISDSKTIDAVIRNFEIIGEASSRLPDELKDDNAEIDWNKIRGLRNRIVHAYFGINYGIIWSVIEDYLPELSAQINELVEEY